MRIVLDPGVTTFQDTAGFFEIVGNSSGKGYVNLISPYSSSNVAGTAGFKLVSNTGTSFGAIYAYGAIYPSNSTAAGTAGVKKISAQSGGTASGGSDGDIILIY
jgi:hypothetical protein